MAVSNGNIRTETVPDGTRLRIGYWPAETPPAGTVIVIHGRTEFLEKYAEVTAELNDRGMNVWAMDWRGQGLSDRTLEHRQKGHIDRFETYVKDLSWFANEVVNARSGPVILLAHSMGGHVAVRAVLEGAVKPNGLIATAPMIALPMSRMGTLGARCLSSLISGAGFGERYARGMTDHRPAQVKFDGNPLTGDRNRFERYYALLADNPELVLGGVTWSWLNAAFRSMTKIRRLSRRARQVCPAVICTPLADRIVSVDAQSRLCDDIDGWAQIRFEDARHELLMESDAIRASFWSVFDDFSKTL
ncbi:MAG: alpha/beta fold hydrolase [Alphaproteobacteria bacterium]